MTDKELLDHVSVHRIDISGSDILWESMDISMVNLCLGYSRGPSNHSAQKKWLVPPAVEDVVQDFMTTFLPQGLGDREESAAGDMVLMMSSRTGSYVLLDIILIVR